MVRDGVRALGLKLYAAEGARSDTVTSIVPPEDLVVSDMLRIARTEFRTVFAGGQGELSGKIFRFGHLGLVREEDVRSGLQALELSLAKLGYKAPAATA